MRQIVITLNVDERGRVTGGEVRGLSAELPVQPASTDELTIRQAAELLTVCPRTVRKYLREGMLPARDAAPLSSRRPAWRIPHQAVTEMRDSYECQSPAARPAHPSSRRAAAYEPKILKNWRREEPAQAEKPKRRSRKNRKTNSDG